jgi:hypothetical protein
VTSLLAREVATKRREVATSPLAGEVAAKRREGATCHAMRPAASSTASRIFE